MATQQLGRYLASLASELESQASRVRDLIGDRHWLTDGHHKEYLLIGLLSRHLPMGCIAARGFVIDPEEPNKCSTEQDILVVDTTIEAPLFNQGNVVIAFPSQVLAAISVKTTLNKATIDDSLKGLRTVCTICTGHVEGNIWCGAFFFSTAKAILNSPLKIQKHVCDWHKNHHIKMKCGSPTIPVGQLDALCSNDLCYFSVRRALTETSEERFHLHGYAAKELSAALFVANVLDHIASRRNIRESNIGRMLDAISPAPLGDPIAIYV